MAQRNPNVTVQLASPTSSAGTASPSTSGKSGGSPRRQADPLLDDLSPSTTLEALSATPGFPAVSGKRYEVLRASIEKASPFEKSFGIRAATVGKQLREWCEELEGWEWDGGFEVPSPDERVAKRRKLHNQDVGNDEELEQEEYWGSLPTRLIKEREDRIEDIRQDLEDLDVDELKEHALDSHIPSRSRPSSSFSQQSEPPPFGSPRYIHLHDFTALVTATILQALPYLSRLNRLLSTWTVRFEVLQEVPGFLAKLEKAQIAMQSGWNAIKATDISKTEAVFEGAKDVETTSDLTREGFLAIRGYLENEVMILGRKMDGMLDALEGREETIPDAWIDAMEDVEASYGSWVVQAERKVLENEWRDQQRQEEEHQRQLLLSATPVENPPTDTGEHPSHSEIIETQKDAKPNDDAIIEENDTAIQPETENTIPEPNIIASTNIFNTSEGDDIPNQDIAAAADENIAQSNTHQVDEQDGASDLKTPTESPTKQNFLWPFIDDTSPQRFEIPDYKPVLGNDDADFSEDLPTVQDQSNQQAVGEKELLDDQSTENRDCEGTPSSKIDGVTEPSYLSQGLTEYPSKTLDEPVETIIQDTASKMPREEHRDEDSNKAQDPEPRLFNQREVPLAPPLALAAEVEKAPEHEGDFNKLPDISAKSHYSTPSDVSQPQGGVTSIPDNEAAIIPKMSPVQEAIEEDNSIDNAISGSASREPEHSLAESGCSDKDLSLADNGQKIVADSLDSVDVVEDILTSISRRSRSHSKVSSCPSDLENIVDAVKTEEFVAVSPSENIPVTSGSPVRSPLSMIPAGHIYQNKPQSRDDLVSSEHVNRRENSSVLKFPAVKEQTADSHSTSLAASSRALNAATQAMWDEHTEIPRKINGLEDPPFIRKPSLESPWSSPSLHGSDKDDGDFESIQVPSAHTPKLASSGVPEARDLGITTSEITSTLDGPESPKVPSNEPSSPYSWRRRSQSDDNTPASPASPVSNLRYRSQSTGPLSPSFDQLDTINESRSATPERPTGEQTISDSSSPSSVVIAEAVAVPRARPVQTTPTHDGKKSVDHNPASELSVNELFQSTAGEEDEFPFYSSSDFLLGNGGQAEPNPFESDLQESKESGESGESDGTGGATSSELRRASVASIGNVSRGEVKSIDIRKSPSTSSIISTPAYEQQESYNVQTPDDPSWEEQTGTFQSAAGLNDGGRWEMPDEDSPMVRHSEWRAEKARGSTSPSALERPKGRLTEILDQESPVTVGKPRRRLSEPNRSTLAVDTPITSPTKGNTENADEHLEQQISEILTTLPARIRLTSGPEADAPEVLSPKGASAGRNLRPIRKARASLGSPALTLAPAYAKNSRPRLRSSDPDIKLYHLHRPGKDVPTKLYVRLVGENGERVMVRVGGGWADLGEYLKEYASHHGQRSISEGHFDIQGLPKRTSIASLRAKATGRSTPISRPGSALGRPTSALDRPASALSVRRTRLSEGAVLEPSGPRPKTPQPQPTQPTTPNPNTFRLSEATPPSATSSASLRSSSRLSWTDEDPALGLAGPKGKNVEISREKQAWVDTVVGKVRRSSAEKKTDWGDLGKAGATRRVYMRGNTNEE
ncbi:MAG: hypothetical protein M1819_002088 [Sarea resinae]|nr:MAG: hypothetical protein M1819_002088 [Sarea resinae]